MVGLVISDTFLLCGAWSRDGDSSVLQSLGRVPFTESISSIIYDEAELNSVLASALRKSKETYPFDGQDVVVGLPDKIITHSIVESDQDLSREDCIDYIYWLESQKVRPNSQSVSIFGQVYLPDESNIHVCSVANALIRTIKLTITELGGTPHWMGPVSSLYLDGSGMSEAAIIQRIGNQYNFMKVQNNRFDMGKVAFTGGVAKVISTTDEKNEITLAALGLEESELDDIPVFCPQKLGRQSTAAWESSDLRIPSPFKGVDINDQYVGGIPEFEANQLTQLITSHSVGHSFNFFDEPGIVDFFFTNVIPTQVEEDVIAETEVKDEKEEVIEKVVHQIVTGPALGLILIVGLFIGFNIFKLKRELNNQYFGVDKGFSIERSGEPVNEISKPKGIQPPSNNLLKQSKSITSALLSILTQTDLDRYNSLTISKSFVSLEYLSGINPNIENILDVSPTSFSVEATGQDSTIFLWYYSFDLPENSRDVATGDLSKMDLMIQLDTLLTDYSLKYFEQVFTENQIYGPMLIWVRNKADILQASAIISNVGDEILLRKFVLFNEADHPEPRAGFYVSILED
jgi:hypothetical protein